MWLRNVVLIAIAAIVSGCANFHAVSEFGKQTTSMTDVVKDELDELDALCVRQAELAIVVNNISNDGPLDQCQRSRRAQDEFAALTVVVLDGYADKLIALGDDQPFDVSPEVKSVGARVRSLKDKSGDTVMTTREANALTIVAGVIVNVLSASKRADAIGEMQAVTPDLLVVGKSLRSFFVAPAGGTTDAPRNALRSPYANLVDVISGSGSSTLVVLDNPQMRRAEPIRTAELSREMRARQKQLARRSATGGDSIPGKVVAAIDAWLAALQEFSTDALKPDARGLVDRMKSLRDATRVAKSAIAGQATTEESP